MYVWMCVRTYVRMYVCMHACMYGCMYARICLYIYITVREPTNTQARNLTLCQTLPEPSPQMYKPDTLNPKP